MTLLDTAHRGDDAVKAMLANAFLNLNKFPDNADGNARGRPVGVAVDARGALLVADDVGNAVWRVVPAP